VALVILGESEREDDGEQGENEHFGECADGNWDESGDCRMRKLGRKECSKIVVRAWEHGL